MLLIDREENTIFIRTIDGSWPIRTVHLEDYNGNLNDWTAEVQIAIVKALGGKPSGPYGMDLLVKED